MSTSKVGPKGIRRGGVFENSGRPFKSDECPKNVSQKKETTVFEVSNDITFLLPQSKMIL